MMLAVMQGATAKRTAMLDDHVLSINPLYIRAAAAEAYWRFARKFGQQRAIVAASIHSPELWSPAQALAYLERRSLDCANGSAEAFCRAVQREIYEHLERGEPLEGVLLAKHFGTGRAPEEKLDKLLQILRADADVDSAVSRTTPLCGELLLRTPLPAGVLLRECVAGRDYLTPDTTKALGFAKDLALNVMAVRPAPRNEYGYTHYASGTFFIHTTQSLARHWFALIPNANALMKEESLAA
jgi:hypothetical protein